MEKDGDIGIPTQRHRDRAKEKQDLGAIGGS